MQQYRLDLIFVLLIIMAGATALFYKIGDTPPLFPWSDESEVAADAVASLKDGLQLIYPIQRSGGSWGVWVETGWMALFGKSLLGLRIFNGLINLASALLLYLLVRQMPFNFQASPHYGRWAGAIAALLFAVSTWLLGLGRIATPQWSLVPLMASLAFFLFWFGLNTKRWGYFVTAGAIMGLLFYGYLPGYLIVSVPLIFLVLVWILNLDRREYFKPAYGWLTFPAALIVAAPALFYFAQSPILVLNRPMQLVNNSELSESDSMLQGGLDMLSAFGLLPNWLLQGNIENLAFDPLITILFGVGLLIALWHWRKSAYLFMLIWWGVMIMPALLSKSASDGFIFEVWRRGIGAEPVSFIFPALAIVSVAQWAQNRWPIQLTPRRQRLVLTLTTAFVVLISAGFSYWLYFRQWANSGVIPLLFAETPVKMVDWMEATGDADTLYLYPIRPRVSYTTRPELFTVRYLFDGQAGVAFPVMDEETVYSTLTDLLDSHPTQIKLMLPDHIVIDPKGYFEYALASIGQVVSREQMFGFTAITYQLDDNARLESSLESTNAGFGDTLQLVGQRVSPEQPAAGQAISVALRWAKTNSDQVSNYNVSLALYDVQGYEVVKVDKPLLSSGDYLTTQHWPPGYESTLYYELQLPPDVPPGPYGLRLVAYNTETGAQLPPVGGQIDLSFPLTVIEVQRNPMPVDLTTLSIAQPIDAQYPGGLRLIGTERSPAGLQQPGDQLRVSLLWQAAKPLAQNIGLMLALAVPDEAPIPLLDDVQPLIADYPTSTWPAGQVYRTHYTMLLPATLTTADYQLALRLINLDSGQPIAEQVLGPVSVEARDHQFEAPALANHIEADFDTPAGDSVIRLLGFELADDLSALVPDQPLALQVQWQALRAMPESYKVFMHLTDATGQILAQLDAFPQQGAAPTTGWLPGEIIEDVLSLTLPSEMSPGSYRLIVGFYDQKSGKRLLTEQGDYVTLFEIELFH